MSSANNKPINLPFKVIRNLTSDIDNLETANKALHETIEIKYFYGGNATLLVGTNSISVKAGDIVVVNPYEFHATVDCGAEKGMYHLFLVPLDFFSNNSKSDINLRSLLLEENKFFKNHIKDDRIAEILLRVVEESAGKQPFCEAVIRGLLLQFFCLMFRNHILNKSDTNFGYMETSHSYKLIEPALRHIRDNYDESFTLEELSKHCGLSKHYFCRAFKTVTGKTPMEYLRDYRIKVSDAMLINTDKSIMQISEMCGFESVNYYSRCYKSFYGFSPSKRRTKCEDTFESLS